MKDKKKIIIGIFIVFAIFILSYLSYLNFSYNGLLKKELKKQYGVSVEIQEKKKNGNEIEYTLNLENEKMKFPCKVTILNSSFLKKEFEIDCNVDSAIKNTYFDTLKKEHKNLSFDNGCFVLKFKDYSDTEEAALSVSHIIEYLEKQEYFKEKGHIGFVRVVFENAITDETSVEFCYGTLTNNQVEFYKDRMYNKETVLEKIQNHYISVSNQYSYQDETIPSDKYANIKLVSNGQGVAKVENYNGYFTLAQAFQVSKDMGLKVYGEEKNFSIYNHNDVYEFSTSFIEGPHTYYIYNGDHYTLSNQENMISEEILSKATGNLTIRNYGTISNVYINDKNINESENKLIFGLDEEPYIYITELPKLFDILQIEYNKDCSLYKKPFIEWKKDNMNYTFDLSYSKYYRKQLGEFISIDDEYWIKNGEIEELLPDFKNNHLGLESLKIMTGYQFDYNKLNHSITITKK